ncbi:NAD(P)-dependent dehydrogenase (short-subunit alcohol dehydrogenase family) [Bradyrhizobium diazoefficiens]
MMADGAGRIVNISSIVASAGHSGLSVYAASKAAVVGFTRSLAREVGRVGITVNAIAPGFIDTELTRSLDDESRRRTARRSALRHLPAADDVASMVEYLLGEGGRTSPAPW